MERGKGEVGRKKRREKEAEEGRENHTMTLVS